MINNENLTIPIQNEEFQLTLRTVNEGDLPDLRQWKNEQREFFFFKGEISPEQQCEWFRTFQLRNNDFMFIVIVNETAIGCMGIRLIEDVWDIYNVILGVEDSGSKGLMSKAFQAMLQFAISRHQNPITLKVLKYNPAVNWYKKNGFEITSEKQDYFCMAHIQQNY